MLANGIAVAGSPRATTIEACQATCHASGYTFAGVEYANECYCDNKIENTGGPAPDRTAGCIMACAGNAAKTCGGLSCA
jgi:glucan 1,3-beta-glucosidase